MSQYNLPPCCMIAKQLMSQFDLTIKELIKIESWMYVLSLSFLPAASSTSLNHPTKRRVSSSSGYSQRRRPSREFIKDRARHADKFSTEPVSVSS